MKWVSIALMLVLGGCSCGKDTVCSQACEKMQQCDVSRLLLTPIKSYGYDRDCGSVSCDSITECISRCIEAADCPALEQVTLGGPLHSCLISCNSFFRVDDAGP